MACLNDYIALLYSFRKGHIIGGKIIARHLFKSPICWYSNTMYQKSKGFESNHDKIMKHKRLSSLVWECVFQSNEQHTGEIGCVTQLPLSLNHATFFPNVYSISKDQETTHCFGDENFCKKKINKCLLVLNLSQIN